MKLVLNQELKKIIISVLLLFLSFVFSKLAPVLISISYIIISLDIYKEAWEHLKNGDIFDENFLMIIATLGAFVIGEYREALLVILLFEIGEYLSDLAVNKSKKTITDLLDLRSDIVHLKINDKIVDTDVKKVNIKDIFVVKPGEKIPLDGMVISGSGYIDTASLTGESLPKHVSINDRVLSGSICKDSTLEIEATSIYETSTASKIIDLIENSDSKKTNTEKFITRFSKIYTPIVCLSAIVIFGILLMIGNDIEVSLYKALVFLVISCPCALVISVPLGFFMGIGRASKEGILVKGSNELELLSKVNAVALDKTGTLTKGVFEVSEIKPIDISEDELLEIVAYAEYFSNHPIAKSILSRYNGKISKKRISNFKEKSGEGIDVKIDDDIIIIGTIEHLKSHNIKITRGYSIGTNIYVAKNNHYVGYLVVSDVIKEESYSLVDNLNKVGIGKVVILSGDNNEIVSKVSKALNVKEYYANLLPTEKVKKLNEIEKNYYVAFIGDGINDAPVIRLANVGISMGGVGSDVAVESSDVVFMKDDPNDIVKAIEISRLTKKVVIYNIILSLVIKILVLILGVLGISSILMAVFADVGVTLITIINTLIIVKKKI